MKIFITGATGYIGHKLAMTAAESGNTVHILVRNLNSPFLPVHPNISIFGGDIRDKHSVRHAMDGCEYVMHAAAIAKYSQKDREEFYNVNVEGTRNVLDVAHELNVKRFIFTSSGATLGPSDKCPLTEEDPRLCAFECDYDLSKYLAEEIVREYCDKGLNAVIVAPPRIYGPGLLANGNAFHRFLKRALSTHIGIIPADGTAIANYAFVNDVVAGHFLALEKGVAGEKYILGGENLTYNRLFEVIYEVVNGKILLLRLPEILLKLWSWFHMAWSWCLHRETQISPRTVSRFLKNRALSIDKAVRQLGYTITPFSQAMRQTIIAIKTQIK